MGRPLPLVSRAVLAGVVDACLGSCPFMQSLAAAGSRPILGNSSQSCNSAHGICSSVHLPADIWDTAGQERFNSMHSSYYYRAHACIMVFDVTRKVTYKNLER
jgi:hypothetical protein